MNNYKLYMHINKINGKKYIGITHQTLQRRWRNGKGYEKSTAFYNAILKYGWNNFEHIVIENNLTLEQANEKEIAYIKEYKTTDRKYGYNLDLGGTKGEHSLETIEKIRKYKLEHKTIFSEQGIENIRKAQLGKKLTDKQKEAVRQNMLKNNPMKNEETRLKVSLAQKGKVVGEKSPVAKKLKCIETNEIFNCLTYAMNRYNNRHIGDVCNGKRETACGYHWKWLEMEGV